MAEANICTICQSSLHDGRDYVTTSCQHMFHTECIAKNANMNNNNCPNCRQPIPSFREIFTGYQSKTEEKKEIIILNEDDENGWNCPGCTYKNSSSADICVMCEQGMRVQAEKIKPNNDIKKSIQEEISITLQCNTPSCNKKDPTSCFLCDECIFKKYSSTSIPGNLDISQEEKQEKSSTSSRPSYPSSSTTEPRPMKTNPMKSGQTEWYCNVCDYDQNLSDNEQCVYCGHVRRPKQTELLTTKSSEQSTTFETDDQLKKQDSSKTAAQRIPYTSSIKQQEKQSTTRSVVQNVTSVAQNKIVHNEDSSSVIVYIPDLPGDKTDPDIAQATRRRLHDVHNIQVSNVQSFSHLGVAIVHLTKQKDKDYLVNILQSFVLFPNDNIKVTCTEKLEVTSYLVFDKNSILPSNDAITRRWTELFSSTRHPHCQTLSIQFPNIIKMTLFSIEELQALARQQVFAVEDQVARFYTHVDCSYLEELPRSQPKLDENRIFCFIATQLNMTDRVRVDKTSCQEQANTLFQQIQSLPLPIKELKSNFYIQYNEQSSNAIILASNSLHQWIAMKFLNINGQLIFKTVNISSKLIIKPIPLNFPLRLIFDHPIFNKTIKTDVAKLNGEHLIVEINDKRTYDECLTNRVFEIMNNGDRLTLRILPYTTLEDPDNGEINVENWYGAQMQKYKPDITQFDPHHPIFRYKWNSKIWLDQFMRNKEELEEITNQDECHQNDFIRRMLRVTVMLNTMAAMRKRKYILEDSSTKTEVLIEPPSSLVTILYNHPSKITPMGQTFARPFHSTNVRVINEDCLISYNTLVSSGMKPLLLNMANATTPGGGYRKGDGAQEENLFRRSNYYMSLDYNMDPEQDQYINSKRIYCSPTGQMLPLPVHQSLYPMDEYGAIYTSGITAFRGTENEGYPFLKRPLYDVCAVAIAAYRDPSIHKNKRRLTSEFAVGTRKKIETLFAIAYKHGHDSLVLSALGCGAFKNPPEHIALIFKSVILQYAGFFKEIIFSVVDDHNTGKRLNPNGNFLPFQQALDKFVAHGPRIQTVGMSLGPHHLIQSKLHTNNITVDEFIVCAVPPCKQGALCENLNDQNHCRSYSHPPLCPLGSECNENSDDVHCQMFIHQRKCSNGGQRLVTDARHLADSDHPDYCPDAGRCNNMRTEHLNLYRHLPICHNGIDCDLRYAQDGQHLTQFRHCQRLCEFGGNCIRFHDQQHITNEQHPFNPPCPYTPFSCIMFTKFLQSNDEHNNSTNQNNMNENRRHCHRYSHICPWGRLCSDQSEEHLSMTIHIARQMCSNGSNSCSRMIEEDHLDAFSHLNVRDIRFLCHYPGFQCCDRSKLEHIIQYRHNYMLDYLGVAQYFALNKQINFVQNQIDMTQMIHGYLKDTYKQAWGKVSVPKDLLEWIAALQPVYRCKSSIFESILIHEQVMSCSHMDSLQDPTFVTHTVEQDKRVRKILASQVPSVQQNARDFIEALVRIEFNIGKSEDEKEENSNESLKHRVHSSEQTLKLTLSKSYINEIRLCTSQIAQASIKLHSDMPDIGYKNDFMFETNQQVFSILGPHTAQYYDDIVIVFKRDIMLHPDSNFTMQAATMYKEKTYKCLPWINDSDSAEDDRVKQFNSTKLHCSVPGYDYVAALELMAITGMQKQTINVDHNDVKYRWKYTDADQIIEAHLPQLIPLSYIDHIYMPKNVFQSLSPEAQKNAQELFEHNLIITKHVVDLTINPMAFSKPDESRKEYENYVTEQILKLIQQQKERHAILSTCQLLTSYGMTVTIPATNFESLITNPLTITQSYDQYLNQSHKTSTSDDSIYIYWKALRGDFMLILTNEMTEFEKVQPDLVYLTCYIAPFVTNISSDPNYDERHTYINHSPPSSHQTVLEQKRFKVGSNTFHKGCNPDDYILYCLKLNPKKRQVSLMNAGVNGIYNQTILDCVFEQTELDLASLDYIHVSAGRQNVSIHNLVISHELIAEAHPKFDKEFGSRDHSQNSNKKSKKTEDIGDQSAMSILYKPIKWVKDQFQPNNEQQPAQDNQSQEYQQVELLKPCRDSIYCFDQYSKEKSLTHNQTYSHPCRFSELCQNIHNIPHCRQFTHNKHDVPKCHQNMNCKQVTDPIHRFSYRHNDLPDYLIPCRDQQRCRNSTFEHRKKYFHGERINLPTIIKNVPKGITTEQTCHPSSSENTFRPRVSHTMLSTQSQNRFQSPNSHSSQPYHTVEQSRFPNPSHITTSSYVSDEHSSSVWSATREESDDEDLLSTFYNADAGKSNITNAGSYDQHGNPTERKYDLGRDGAYTKFNILIAQFNINSQLDDKALQVPIDALKVKGFQVEHVKTENECIRELASNRYQIAWIISTHRIQNPSFISALIAFHSSGGGIFLFADNTPHVCHASEFLKAKFGITVDGTYHGGKTLTYKENGHQQTGNFGQHEIFTGITNLFEGITRCHPVYSTPESRKIFVTIATATNGDSSIAVYDPPATSGEGRLCLDCGFRKLYINWNSAGTARYIVNASCWLLGIEKRLKSKKTKPK